MQCMRVRYLILYHWGFEITAPLGIDIFVTLPCFLLFRGTWDWKPCDTIQSCRTEVKLRCLGNIARCLLFLRLIYKIFCDWEKWASILVEVNRFGEIQLGSSDVVSFA